MTFARFILPLLRRHRCSSIKNLRISSAVNGRATELWRSSDLTVYIRPLIDSQMSSRRHKCLRLALPLWCSVCLMALLPIVEHLVRCNHPGNYMYLPHHCKNEVRLRTNRILDRRFKLRRHKMDLFKR